MKLERQVCTLKQANKLKELGIEQGLHLFGQIYWLFPASLSVLAINSHCDGWIPTMTESQEKLFARAFTVAELGIMIDWNFVSATPPYKKEKKWGLHTLQDSYINVNEAKVRADILIYLLENNIMSVKTCNKRLSA
jgi:hypothetical protein